MDVTTAIELDRDYSLRCCAYSVRGFEHQQLGEYREAIEDYERHFEMKPHNAGLDELTYYFRGIAYVELGDETRAIADFKTAARLGDESAKEILIKNGLSW